MGLTAAFTLMGGAGTTSVALLALLARPSHTFSAGGIHWANAWPLTMNLSGGLLSLAGSGWLIGQAAAALRKNGLQTRAPSRNRLAD